MVTTTKAPAYFISHGGPPTMFEHKHPAYQHWLQWGMEVRTLHEQGLIRGLVFVSAHWQAEDLEQGVYVNVDETNPMIYDFYGFPHHFYKQKVESSNPSNISALVLDHLRSAGVPAQSIKRGIDHGVWCPLKVAFQKPYLEELTPEQRKDQQATINTPSVLPVSLSLTQVSLPTSDSSFDSLKLGAALRGLRDQGFAIVGGGMSVHNLRDLMRSFALAGGRGFGSLALDSDREVGKPQPNAYSESFLKALREAMTVPPASQDEDKWGKALKLDRRADFLPAHPSAEHFLPALVAMGAAHPDEQGVETFALDEGPMGWNMYKWG
ncbi:Extradiol ring-cleavage dioxygenase, class III enzyme, subunit B [Kalmanozyma brasiliensis GHG001]|uniref:Extradiol ring-cleavage dioxygenase class III enzyme subunit B domain-containing protein n=1 Tax=Kalmanozyma brasiliensis (strain GHG001) TaxID=1365824 RepID=V5F1M7_KALBG|nr:Extradiol ring-cleavage dioxygenase, class III enzyme, subunit B [Kalmanozyma brasiliensis GHG001]EST09204.1 Extradiol ring-cleavage dioxygenase, class III enzyme, subunit B [Kalmanozyma brasiliensis GHG001]